MNPHRFVNDVVKPWDELNTLLSQRYAFQPDLSDVTRLAGTLAVAIKHQADLAGYADRSTIDIASLDHKLMSDVSDFWRHGPLRDAGRNNSLSVRAMFEYDPQRGFRFLRNRLVIQHETLGEHDFMHTSLAAIRYWLATQRIGLSWSGAVAEGLKAEILYQPTHPRYGLRSIRPWRQSNFRLQLTALRAAADPAR